MAGCEDLGGPGAGPGPAGRGSAAWAGKKPTCVFAPCALLCSALLGDSSCGFHSAAPRPAQQHSAAAEDEDDEDDDEKMTILMNKMMTIVIVMITKSENELSFY